MKRLISIGLYLISCVCLVAQTTKTYTLTFDREAFSIITTEEGHYIESDEYDLVLEDDTLKPAIPYVYINILLPDGEGMDEFTYNIESSETTSQVTLGAVPSLTETSDLSVNTASTTSNYPIQNYPSSVELSEVSIMDGYHIARFKISPISYNAAEHKINWTAKVNLTITTSPMVSSTNSVENTHLGSMNNCLLQILHNPEDLNNTPLTLSTGTMSEEDNVDYVIITSEGLKDCFQPLADWKTIKGLRSEIVTTEFIYANYSGSSNQLKIKAFLNSYYQNKQLKYVLLGGDDNIVPTQGCYGKVSTRNGNKIDEKIPADIFYTCFDKTFNWDANGNGIIGEPADDVDYSPEICHARIPIKSTIDAQTFVNRIISYEKATVETDHFLRFLLAGVQLSKRTDNGQSDTEVKSDYMYDNYIKNFWTDGNITRFYDTSTDFPEGASYAMTAVNLQEQLESGFHFLNIETHGSQTSWSMESGYPYSTSNASSLQSLYPTIIATTACTTNAFDASSNNSYKTDPCLSEAFIRNPNSGVLAYLGSSRYGWGYANANAASLGPSLELNALFYEELFNGTADNFAELVTTAKVKLGTSSSVYKWLLYSVNPIGDPAMSIFTAIPETFNDISILWNEGTLQVNSGISECTITLSKYDTENVEYFHTINETQSATFSNLENGDYTLCVTKTNHKPSLTRIVIGTEYIQNESITDNVIYLTDELQIGNNVAANQPVGNVTIHSGASVSIEADGSVIIENGFTCEDGAVLQIK